MLSTNQVIIQAIAVYATITKKRWSYCYPTPEYNEYPNQKCISVDAPILNNDKYLKEATYKKGESFTLSCDLANFSSRRDTINYGWALVKDGHLLKMLNSNKYMPFASAANFA